MIVNLILLFAYLFHCAFGHVGVGDEPPQKEKSTSPSLRFADPTTLARAANLIQVFLYRSAEDEGTRISFDGKGSSLDAMNPDAKTYVLFNGHPSSDSIEPFRKLRETLFALEDANIIFVFIDWTKHQISFNDVLALGQTFGQYIGENLFALGIRPNHIIGHCAGAEIASSVSKNLAELSHSRVERLTVFDPYITNTTNMNYATAYVEFVDVYHAGIYDPPFQPVGNVDFYPNAGVNQPGCEAESYVERFACSHRRSIYLYIESITTLVNAIQGRYDNTKRMLQVMLSPRSVQFGHMVDVRSTGAFYLPTFDRAPFLMDYF